MTPNLFEHPENIIFHAIWPPKQSGPLRLTVLFRRGARHERGVPTRGFMKFINTGLEFLRTIHGMSAGDHYRQTSTAKNARVINFFPRTKGAFGFVRGLEKSAITL